MLFLSAMTQHSRNMSRTGPVDFGGYFPMISSGIGAKNCIITNGNEDQSYENIYAMDMFLHNNTAYRFNKYHCSP